MKRFLFPCIAFAVALAMVFGALTGGPARAEHEADTLEQKEMERAFEKFLYGHPDVVVDILRKLREREEATKAENMSSLIAAQRETLLNDPTSPVGGNPNGEVTVVEFFDYNCGYCKRVMPNVIKLMEEDSGVRLVYKEFPILGPGSVSAARAALASLRQDPGKYQAFHTALMSSRGRLKMPKIMQIAREIGFDTDRLEADMAAPEIEATIARNLALARTLGINGTPSFVIGDQLVPGAVELDTLKRLVARARAS